MAIQARCVDCGERYQFGADHKCKKPSGLMQKSKVETFAGKIETATKRSPSGPAGEDLEQARPLIDGRCPNCQQPIGPAPNAERQRRYRERRAK